MADIDPLAILRDFIKEFGTQREAAEALDVSQSYLSAVLSRERPPSAKILKKLGLKITVVQR